VNFAVGGTAHGAERRVLDLLLEQFRDRGWIKERGQQRTDSTHVRASIRTMNRLECVGETMRHALNVLAEAAPEWLEKQIQPEWGRSFCVRFTDFRLPKEANQRLALAEQIGVDGRALLEAVYASVDVPWLRDLPAIQTLRQVWIQHYHASAEGTPWRQDQDMPPSAQVITSPYDVEARYSRKRNTIWTGDIRPSDRNL
jgi:transposase